LKTINEESMPHCRDTVARDHKEIRPKFRKILGSLELGGVRYMGIGSFKGGGRPAEHELRLPPTLKPDGSKAKHEQDERERFLGSAKQDLATRISDTERTLQDSTVEESSQTHVIGGATTELQFGVQDGGPSGAAVDNAYEELLKKSEVSDHKRQTAGDKGQSLEETSTITDHDADNSEVEIATEVWSAMDGDTSHFLDDSDKVEVQGQENKSIMGIGSQGPGESLQDESTGPGETVHETLDATRAENRSGSKARTPKPGVRVGNVPATGASANETDRGDIPTLSSKQQSSGGETLDHAQQQYEKSISEFGLGGDQNLKADP